MPPFLLLLLLFAAASTSLSPTERSLRAGQAGLTGWANTADRSARNRHAGRGLYEKFYRATDPSLPAAARAKMADSAYRAHFQRMAFYSAKARRLRREQQQADALARAEARRAEAAGGAA